MVHNISSNDMARVQKKKKSPQIVSVVENKNDKRAVKGEGNLS